MQNGNCGFDGTDSTPLCACLTGTTVDERYCLLYDETYKNLPSLNYLNFNFCQRDITYTECPTESTHSDCSASSDDWSCDCNLSCQGYLGEIG